MEKPRAFIHRETTDVHDFLGVLYIGKFILPLIIPAIFSGVLFLLALIFGVVWDSVTLGGDFGLGWTIFITVGGPIALVWALFGAIIGLKAGWRSIRELISDANGWSKR